MRLGAGVVRDLQTRLPSYRSDWLQGWSPQVLAPALFIFFASALPALAFGQQLATETEGRLTVVHVLAASALSGLAQAVIGGQPLLIVGVAEPVVIIYGFLFSFARSAPGLGAGLFVAWAGWVCVFTSAMCMALALLGACEGIQRFTRFSGELFGALIALLFLQVGIKGMVQEFAAPPGRSYEEAWQLTLINGLWGLLLALGLLWACLQVQAARSWLLWRGWLRALLADYGVPLVVVAFSAASFAVTPAPHVPRRVLTPNTWEVTDWAVVHQMGLVPGRYVAAALLPAAVISTLFYFDHSVSAQLAQQPEFNLHKGTAYHYDFLLLSFMTLLCGIIGLPPTNGVLPQAPMHTRTLAHIRKRPAAGSIQADPEQWPAPAEGCGISTPRCHAAAHHSDGELDSSEVPQLQLSSCAANTCMPAQHAQEPGDVTVAVAAAMAQLELGRSPAGTVQQRLHTFSQQLSLRVVDDTRASEPAAASSSSGQQAALRHRATHSPSRRGSTDAEPVQHQRPQHAAQRDALRATSSKAALNTLPDSAAAAPAGSQSGGGSPGAAADDGCFFLRLEVREQRVTNLLQSLGLAACLGITGAIKLIPTSVLWGFFVFMAITSLQGSQLWERLLFLATDPRKRLQREQHPAYLQTVPFRVVAAFTLLQVVLLLGVWALTTWAGIAGVAFPLPIMALVPLRQVVLPRLFEPGHLSQLDAASYEAAPPVDALVARQELCALGAGPEAAAVTDGGGTLVLGDEGEVLSQEFRGLRITHHLTRPSLVQQAPPQLHP